MTNEKRCNLSHAHQPHEWATGDQTWVHPVEGPPVLEGPPPTPVVCPGIPYIPSVVQLDRLNRVVCDWPHDHLCHVLTSQRGEQYALCEGRGPGAGVPLSRGVARAGMPVPRAEYALRKAEPILSLLRYRGLVDSPANRADVAHALEWVQHALGQRDSLPLPPPSVDPWPVEVRGRLRRILAKARLDGAHPLPPG